MHRNERPPDVESVVLCFAYEADDTQAYELNSSIRKDVSRVMARGYNLITQWLQIFIMVHLYTGDFKRGIVLLISLMGVV